MGKIVPVLMSQEIVKEVSEVRITDSFVLKKVEL